MLNFIGRGTAQTCDGVTRRDFLQVGSLGALGFALSDLFALKAQGAVEKGHDERSVIMIFNLGAPSQLDTWDMKPDAPAEIRGPFKPISTDRARTSRSPKSSRCTPSWPTSFRSCEAAITRRPACTTPGIR